jgi:hypothetical protein
MFVAFALPTLFRLYPRASPIKLVGYISDRHFSDEYTHKNSYLVQVFRSFLMEGDGRKRLGEGASGVSRSRTPFGLPVTERGHTAYP